MYTLDQVPVGDTAVVKKIHGEGRTRRRIMDMGLTRGISVLVRRVAPLGDPIELKVRGYELSIRKTEAAAIEVEEPDIH
ncbi:MAG: ferrous iron transport protein A [Veillonellaceae bacterium]|nr:MAG: ferrous iron transport protein A [Veillonellaceae bacterium]